MLTVNEFISPQSSNGPARLQSPVEFPDKTICARIMNETNLSLKNTGGSSYTLTNADALDIMRQTYGTFSMGFGNKKQDVVDDAIAFDDLRMINFLMVGRDVLFNNKQLKDYQSTDGNAVVMAAGATVLVTMELTRPFEFQRFDGAKIQTWCPGATQMRQLKWAFIKSGAGFAANGGLILQQAPGDNVVMFDTLQSEEDPWVQPPRLYRTNDAGLKQSSPPGGLIACYEITAPGATTALQLISLVKKKDPTPLHDKTLASRINRDVQLMTPPGTFDVSTLVTVLYMLEEKATLRDVPTSDEFTLIQHSQYLAPMQSRWLMVPPFDEDYANTKVQPNLVSPGAPPVKIAMMPAVLGQKVDNHIASISSVAIIPTDHPKYETIPGTVFESGQPPKTHIPQALLNNIQANVGTGTAAGAKAAQETQSLANFIPGATSPRRGGFTARAAELLGHVASKVGGAIHQEAHGLLGKQQ